MEKTRGLHVLINKPGNTLVGLHLREQLNRIKDAYRRVWHSIHSGSLTEDYHALSQEYYRLIGFESDREPCGNVKQEIHIDVFVTHYFQGGSFYGFAVYDEHSLFPMEVFDEWASKEDFLRAFPSPQALIDFVKYETGYKTLV